MTSENSTASTEVAHQALIEFSKQFKSSINEVIIGQEEVLDLLVTALFCQGHILLTGVPGLAKTLLIKALSRLFHLEFNRVQCTPDLMPSDITGTEILTEIEHSSKREFRFVKGPVFTNLLLADELNRTSPRTQAALLQAMQEHQVTVSGQTYPLPQPFLVFATRNPIDAEGTYALPEAQLDRFLFNIDLTYPSFEDELLIADTLTEKKLDTLQPMFSLELLHQCQQLVPEVPFPDSLKEWIVHFVRNTRPQTSPNSQIKEFVEWGAGVRASQNIMMAARAKALLDGDYVVKSKHIRNVLKPVLRHRILLNFVGTAEQWTPEKIIDHLLETSPFPTS